MPTSISTPPIGDIALFADCTKAQLQKIDALTTDIRIPQGSVLIREGSVAKEFIVIRNGSVEVTRETDQGVVKVADLADGDFLGEMALLGGTRRTATVTASSDLEVLVSSAGEFRSLLEVAPSVAHRLRHFSAVRAASLGIAA